MQGGEEVLELDTIYKEYALFIYKYLYSFCHDEHMAEELMQETFYQAVRSANKYDGTCKVSTWLCQIAKHLWYQELDRKRRKGTSELAEELAADHLDLSEKMIQKEEVLDVLKRVHLLEEVSKEVFLLRIMGELSFREIGSIFGKNENWARVTFYRAKQKVVKGWTRNEV